MKNNLKLVLMACLVLATLQSCSKDEVQTEKDSLEINKELKATSGKASKGDFQDLGPSLPEGSLNLETMLEGFENKKERYFVNVSVTSIISSFTTKPIVGYTLKEDLYWEVGSIGYWRADCSLQRSDYGFSSANHFEVLVYPDSSNPEIIDKNQIWITWRSGELGLNTFILENVSVRYIPDGILINGSYTVRDSPIGVSIAISPKY